MTDATVPRRSDIYLFTSVLSYLDDALMTQAFQQIRPQQTQGGGGSGMGLWICREASSLCHRTNDQMDIISRISIDPKLRSGPSSSGSNRFCRTGSVRFSSVCEVSRGWRHLCAHRRARACRRGSREGSHLARRRGGRGRAGQARAPPPPVYRSRPPSPCADRDTPVTHPSPTTGSARG